MANAFESEIHQSAVDLGIYYEKVPIPTKPAMMKGKLVLLKLKENPYDSFIVHRGRHIALELKSQDIFDTFPLGHIRQCQIDGMGKIVQHGAPAFLLINMRREEKKGKAVSNNRAWAFDFRRWSDLQAELAGRKSITTELLTDPKWFLEIPRTHVFVGLTRALVWDLRCILNYLDEKPIAKPRPASWFQFFGRRTSPDAVQLQDEPEATKTG